GAGAAAAAARPAGTTIPGAGVLPGAAAAAVPGAAVGAIGGGTGTITKYTSLRFVTKLGRIAQSGYLDDIRLTADLRTHSITTSAAAGARDLLEAPTRELDVPPAARAEINIFPLKKADAASMAATIQQLYLGSSSLTANVSITGTPGVGGTGTTGGVG